MEIFTKFRYLHRINLTAKHKLDDDNLKVALMVDFIHEIIVLYSRIAGIFITFIQHVFGGFYEILCYCIAAELTHSSWSYIRGINDSCNEF